MKAVSKNFFHATREQQIYEIVGILSEYELKEITVEDVSDEDGRNKLRVWLDEHAFEITKSEIEERYDISIEDWVLDGKTHYIFTDLSDIYNEGLFEEQEKLQKLNIEDCFGLLLHQQKKLKNKYPTYKK